MTPTPNPQPCMSCYLDPQGTPVKPTVFPTTLLEVVFIFLILLVFVSFGFLHTINIEEARCT
jgi:hypothetical protein